MDKNKLIDGKKIAADLRAETAVKVEAFKKDFNKVPTLAVVLVGEDEMSSELLSVKDMNTGEQSNMKIQDLIAKFS